MEKINIAEILKDCPKGMELDCLLYDNIVFDSISDWVYPIKVISKDRSKSLNLTKYGCISENENAKCIIFPKGKTTWEGFQRPFKDGDILSYQCGGLKNRSIYIYMYHDSMNTSYYVALSGNSSEFLTNCRKGCALNGYNDTARLATEEEKQKLFDAIKANGYKWNPETKTLEKLPKFKVGDTIKHRLTGDVYKVLFVLLNGYGGGVYDVAVTNEIGKSIDIKEQDSYELVPNKFDISTLVPFESRVLVRDNKSEIWFPAVWGLKTDGIYYPYIIVGGGHYNCCIPYESNEYLLGTTNDCPDFYKTWEG